VQRWRSGTNVAGANVFFWPETDVRRSRSPMAIGIMPLTRKKVLAACILLMTAALLLGLLGILASSLNPNEHAKALEKTTIDVAGLHPGSAIRQRTAFGDVWVYHRTPEQIAWLRENSAARPADWLPHDAFQLPTSVDKTLRSVSDEYFVFIVDGRDDKIYLEEGPVGSPYTCYEFQPFGSRVSVAAKLEFFGGFRCDAGHWQQIVFDLSGRSNIDWIWPLRIPHYRISDSEIEVSRRELFARSE